MDTVLLQGDCLHWIPLLPAQSVDLVFCDPPFGAIKKGRCKDIDRIIPHEKLWECFRHVLKPSGTVIWFGTQPYISQVVCSNVPWFRYEIIWRHKRPSNFLSCNSRPMCSHQTIVVFSERGATTYNPQMEAGLPYLVRNRKPAINGNVLGAMRRHTSTINEGTRYPSSILAFKEERRNVHPFQKPLALVEWIVKTYSNEGMTVLDPTVGSGTTGVVCRMLGRKFVGVEQNQRWFTIARDRIYAVPMKGNDEQPIGSSDRATESTERAG